MADKKMVRIYIIAAPIGSYIGDFSYSAINALNNLSFIFSESLDCRLIKKLRKLQIVSKKTKIIDISSEKEIMKDFCKIDKLIKAKTDFGIMANTGIPGFLDPGRKIINYCLERYLDKAKIIPLGLSSALDAALCLSGENMDTFAFLGLYPNMLDKSESRLNMPVPLIFL